MSRTTELPATILTLLAFRRRKKSSALSSPSATYSAATWKEVEPNRGSAIATCAFHFGSASSSTDFGASDAATLFVLYAMTRTRAENPVHMPDGSLNIAGMSAAEGD